MQNFHRIRPPTCSQPVGLFNFATWFNTAWFLLIFASRQILDKTKKGGESQTHQTSQSFPKHWMNLWLTHWAKQTKNIMLEYYAEHLLLNWFFTTSDSEACWTSILTLTISGFLFLVQVRVCVFYKYAPGIVKINKTSEVNHQNNITSVMGWQQHNTRG